MNRPSDAHELEQIIYAVTEEVLGYLGVSQRILPAAPRAVTAASAERISAQPNLGNADTRIAALIDHTLLRPEASRSEIENLCNEAVRFGFATVCVNAWYVPLAVEQTRGSSVKVCTVVGFPLGATLTTVKIHEAEEAIKLGAQEIDVVQNIGALKSGQEEQVEADLRGVVEASHRGGALCKVILETALLSTEEKMRSARLAKRAGADFVKTSTGFSTAGATAEDIALLRSVVGTAMGIKAAGGIRSLEDFERMVRAGATRIGTSAGIKILTEKLQPGHGSDQVTAADDSEPLQTR